MPVFDTTVTSEQVIAAFSPQVKGRVFVITDAGQPSIGRSMATALAKGSPASIVIESHERLERLNRFSAQSMK